IQTCGRAARNAEGRVIFYADKETDSIRITVQEVERRRERQFAYNAERGIEPRTILKPIRDSIEALYDMDYSGPDLPVERDVDEDGDPALALPPAALRGEIERL